MNAAGPQISRDKIREMIAERAYEMWESQGRSHGRDHIHWMQAEQEVLSCLRENLAAKSGETDAPAGAGRKT
jgi:hypothetical protein